MLRPGYGRVQIMGIAMPRKKKFDTKSHTKDIAASWARERPDLDLNDYLYLLYVMRVGRILDKLDEIQCRRQYGISGADMRVLFALRRSGEPFARRPTDLYRALLITSGAITKQVDRLEKLELVRRLPDPTNAGGFLVQATAEGVRIADTAIGALAGGTPLASAHSSLNASERRQLIKLCEKLLLDLEADLPAAEGDGGE